MDESYFFRKSRSILITTIVILLITLILGEIVFRIYNHYFPSHVFYTSTYNQYRGKAYANDYGFKLNSQGFKDTEFSKKKENNYRVLGIGDSFTFGVVPYQYNYLTLLESKLTADNASIEVFNFGIPGIGPKDYLSLFVKEALAYQPDMLLLSFFIGNDFDDSKRKRLYHYSYVASLVKYIKTLSDNYEGNIIHGKQYCDECPAFSHDKFLKIEHDRSYIYLENNKKFFKQLEDALYYLKEIYKICDQNGIEMVVVIIPDELQINKDLFNMVKETFYSDLPNDEWNITLPNVMLSNELNLARIKHIDLFEQFSQSSEQLYRPRDTHWNIAGNQLAADIIAEYIQEFHDK